VAVLPAEFKLGLFQWIADSVDDGVYPTILDAIKAQQQSGASQVKGGKTVISARGGGYQTDFALPGNYSQEELFSFWAELRRIHTYALSNLATRDGNLNPTQPQIATEMQADDAFTAVRVVYGDYNCLRMFAGGTR
jgi:hypothetical protein